MSHLTPRQRIRSRLQRVRRDGERGAVATVVVILLAGGVLLGFLAIVVDVGQLYAEREELQSGADAGALAVAKACSTAAPACASYDTLLALAGTYADDNAADGQSNVVELCGRLVDKLSSCEIRAGNLTDCLGTDPDSGPFVEVRLGTRAGERTVLPPIFAQTMAGYAGYDGTSVGACARAKWEPPESVTVLGLTISTCEFDDLAGGGFADVGNLSPSDDRRIDLVGGHSRCRLDPEPPWSEAGPAGWLDANGSCEVHVPSDGVLSGGFSADPSTACEARLRAAARSHETIYLAVHDKTQDQSGSRDYHHINLAPFIVTGFYFGPDNPTGTPHDHASWLSDPSAVPCGDDDEDERCLSGVFVGPLISTAGVIGGGAVALVG